MRAVRRAILISKFQGEHAIWNDSEFDSLIDVHSPAKWLALRCEVVFGKKPSAREPGGKFNRDHYV